MWIANFQHVLRIWHLSILSLDLSFSMFSINIFFILYIFYILFDFNCLTTLLLVALRWPRCQDWPSSLAVRLAVLVQVGGSPWQNAWWNLQPAVNALILVGKPRVVQGKILEETCKFFPCCPSSGGKTQCFEFAKALWGVSPWSKWHECWKYWWLLLR